MQDLCHQRYIDPQSPDRLVAPVLLIASCDLVTRVPYRAPLRDLICITLNPRPLHPKPLKQKTETKPETLNLKPLTPKPQNNWGYKSPKKLGFL